MLGILFATRQLFRRSGLLLVLAVAYAPAQTIPAASDDSVLKQIILFGRHGVRSGALPYSSIQMFASRPYPDFGVPTGYLTPHGYQAQKLLGAYYHDYLVYEGLLSGDPSKDLQRSYFRANSIQRSNVSAAALGAALLPGVITPVHSFPLGTPDPVFDPIAGGVVTTVDTARAVAEAAGIFNSGTAIQGAYAPELSLIRSVLFNYPIGTQPLPPVPPGLVDPTSLPVPLTANPTPTTFNVINIGGIIATVSAADPFVMEYADGFPLNQVAWGQLDLEALSQQTRLIVLSFQLLVTPPYVDQIQSSNAASHILRTMEQAVKHEAISGAFGDENSELVVINSSDTYVTGVAGLLHVHWLLSGYQPDYCAPGGNLVFELRQSKAGEYFVRVYYTAQTLDEIRNLTPLTLDQPPETMQLLIPGGSKSDSSLDVDFMTFEKLLRRAIGQQYVQNPETETPPGVLTADFAVASQTPHQVVVPGASAAYTIRVTSAVGTFTNMVTLTATGLPPGSSYSFTPSTIVPGASGATSTLGVVAPRQSAAFNPSSRTPLMLTVLLLPLVTLVRPRAKPSRLLLWLTMTLVSLGTLTACGGSSSNLPPPQTYTITITGTSGNVTRSTTATLTVQ